MKFKILTFNWHEPYICLLAKMGHEFIVAEPEIQPGNIRRWDVNMRPVPGNVKVVSTREAEVLLEKGSLDLAIAHNVKDLIWLGEFSLPKVMVFHNRLTTELQLSNQPIDRLNYLHTLQPLLQNVEKVFISESKRKDWGLEGNVILPGVDLDDYRGYTGETRSLLRVGNLLKERDLMMGFSAGQAVMNGSPCITLGLNPTLEGSRLSRGWEDLKEHYKRCRVYLNATVDEFEDGYNLAMLEAMATGMPVVSTANRTSPVVDGVNGFVSDDISHLKKHAEELLSDPEKARKMGEAARKTVLEKFPLEAFLNSWQSTIHNAALNYLKNNGVSMGEDEARLPFHKKTKKNILMDYVSYPPTTAFYMERALRKSHNVITCGAMITPEIKRLWNLEALKWEASPQDIFRAAGVPIADTLSRLPEKWRPDFYLWVETGLDTIPEGLETLSVPKACYLIDTHINKEKHLEIARRFDFVFLTQKAYVEEFKSKGHANVQWLPLACDPEIHGKTENEKLWDVGFVGSVTPSHARRKRLLDAVENNFDLNTDRKFMDEMAGVFCQSRIVFNNAIRDDLNMRVFEALCSGSMLVTDEAQGSGLTELFKDGEHLAVYHDDSLLDTIQYYLDRPEERERIAERGRREVLERHTYEHRAKFLVSSLEEYFEKNPEALETEDTAKPRSYYENIRYDVVPLVPKDAKCILEVGCAGGQTGKVLKELNGAFVAGLELNPEAARQARTVLDDVVVGNIETLKLPYQEKCFDCIVMADIIEHLAEPEAALNKLKKYLKPGGSLVASIPNVQFFGVLSQLAEGNWTYQKEGILDETHLRFFTYKEIEKLFKKAGFEITRVEETLDPQYKNFEGGSEGTLKIGRMTLSDLTPEEMRRFFVFQYKIAAKLQDVPKEDKRETGQKDLVGNLLREAKDQIQNGKLEAGVESYEKILAVQPQCEEALVGKANCQMRLKMFSEAEIDYSLAIKYYPESVDAWFGLGVLATHRGEFERALKFLSRALKCEPKHEKALCASAMASSQAGLEKEAMDHCVRVLEINLENGQALKLLLDLSYARNEFSQAEIVLKQLAERYPANFQFLFGLAGVQFKLNHFEEAQKNLEALLTKDPENEDAQQMMACLSDKIPVQ